VCPKRCCGHPFAPPSLILSIASIDAAYADSEGGQNANTQFTQTPGFLVQAPAQNAPVVATAQNGQAVRAYVTQSSQGTWLFPPHQGGNG
jgi:hypothetical protein